MLDMLWLSLLWWENKALEFLQILWVDTREADITRGQNLILRQNLIHSIRLDLYSHLPWYISSVDEFQLHNDPQI